MSMIRVVSANEKSIAQAADILKNGGLVGIPTETVYGLAANAFDGQAVARIFEAKGRPNFNPLITHCASYEQALSFVDILPAQEEIFAKLAQHFWPGPLTMILPRADKCAIAQLATAGLSTIALRVPAHVQARALIAACGFPLVAPSANKSGSLSPTTPAHVVESLGETVDMVLAAGACTVGLESTILDLSGDSPVILRPGAISADDILTRTGIDASYDIAPRDNPKSPGQLLKHYAPNIPVRMNAIDLQEGEALLAFGSDKFMGIIGGGGAYNLPESQRRNLSENSDLHEAAANLFAMLKSLDTPAHKAIAVMAVPDEGLGIAINDRLKRAARRS